MKRQINIINYCEKTSEYLKPISLEEVKENYREKVLIKVLKTRMPY